MHRADTKVFRINLHFSVKYGGSDQSLGVEAQRIGLPALYLEAVHQVIIVENVGRRGRRAGNVQVENADVILVEIGLQEVAAGELAQDVVLFEAGNAVGSHHFPLEGGVRGMVHVRQGLRDHHGDEGLAGDGRCIGIVFHKAQIAFHKAPVQDVLHIGGIHLQLGVESGLPGFRVVRIIFLPGLVNLPEDGLDIPVVRLHYGCVQEIRVCLEPEVEFIERAGCYGDGKAFVANDMGREDTGILGGCFQAVSAVQVG